MALRPTTLIAMVASMVLGITIGVVAFNERPTPEDAPAADTLANVLSEVSKTYVTEIPEHQLLGDALRGMMSGLDTHSVYLDADEYSDLQADTTGQFGGIGVQLGLVEGFFTVIYPIEHTPAARAGLLSGDIVTAVDGDPVKGVKLRDLVNRLRGLPGSQVTLAVRRGDGESAVYDLTRERIEVQSVASRLIEDDIGYVRISNFQTNTGKDVERALTRLQFDSESRLKGLILDLRNNPGGILQQSVAVVDAFLTEGLIVYTDGRQRSNKLRYNASGKDLMDGAPIAVLINRGSASASEIVAGALQDHDRAVIIGGQSFGKGSVQSVVPFGGGRAIKLTTALYYTPNGRSIQDTGITPDIASDLTGEAIVELAAAHIRPEQTPLHASKVD